MANNVPYSTSMFSFGDVRSFDKLMSSLHFAPKTKLKKLHLGVRWELSNTNGGPSWYGILQPRLLHGLQSLRSLDLNIELSFPYLVLPQHLACWYYRLASLIRFQELLLKQTRVLISDDKALLLSTKHRSEHVVRLGWVRKRAVAVYYESCLPNGPPAFSADIQAMRLGKLRLEQEEKDAIVQMKEEENKRAEGEMITEKAANDGEMFSG